MKEKITKFDADLPLSSFDERNAYMIGNAQVGIVESTLVCKLRELFEILANSKGEAINHRKSNKEDFLKNLFLFVCKPIPHCVRNDKNELIRVAYPPSTANKK